MAMYKVLGDTAMDSSLKIFSTYSADYNYERMEVYRKSGKLAGDLFITRMGIPKVGNPIKDNWKIDRKLFWMNDYTPKTEPLEWCQFGYNRNGPFKLREKKLCKRFLKITDRKMCMPPGVDEPLIWENIRPPHKKHVHLPPIVHNNTHKRTTNVPGYKSQLFQEVKPVSDPHFDIHPEFRSELIKDQMNTKYWEDGSIFTDPKNKGKKRNYTDLPI